MPSPSSPGTWVTSSTFIQAAAHLSRPATGSGELKLESRQRIPSSGEKGQIFEKFNEDGGYQKMCPRAL